MRSICFYCYLSANNTLVCLSSGVRRPPLLAWLFSPLFKMCPLLTCCPLEALLFSPLSPARTWCWWSGATGGYLLSVFFPSAIKRKISKRRCSEREDCPAQWFHILPHKKKEEPTKAFLLAQTQTVTSRAFAPKDDLIRPNMNEWRVI